MVLTLMVITRARSSASKNIVTHAAPRDHEQDHARDRHRWSATPTRWSSSSPGTRATPTSVHLHQPRLRPVLVGLLDDGHAATCSSPQLFWFKKVRTSIVGHVRRLDLRQHRHVVRALRHHRDLAAPRLPAVDWGYFTPDAGRHRRPSRQLRPVLHPVPALRPLPADGRDGRGEGRPAAGRSASRDAARAHAVARRGRQMAPVEAPPDGPAESHACRPERALRASSPSSTRRGDALPRLREACATPATRSWDAHTPFPVHGLDQAMGLRPLAAAVRHPGLRRSAARSAASALQMLGERARLPAGHQRQALLQLAAVRADHLRAAACCSRRSRRRVRHVRVQPAADAVPSALRLRALRAGRPTTASSSRSRPGIRSSTPTATERLLASTGATRVELVKRTGSSRRRPRPATVSHVGREPRSARSSGRRGCSAAWPWLGGALAVVGLGAALALAPAASASSTSPGSSPSSFFLSIALGRALLRPRPSSSRAGLGRGAAPGGRERHGDPAGLRAALRADLARPPRALRVDDAEEVAQNRVLQGKQPFLNEGFFVIRAMFYFVVWSALAIASRRQSQKQDDDRRPSASARACGDRRAGDRALRAHR